MPLRTADLDYELPPDLIATAPADPRDSARLLVVHSSTDQLTHSHVSDLPNFLNPGDSLVVNSTRVIPARLDLRREKTGRRSEGLFLDSPAQSRWRCLLRGKLHPGETLRLLNPEGADSPFTLHLLDRDAEAWLVEPKSDDAHSTDPDAILNLVGRTPLPPYILKSRLHTSQTTPDALDRDRYQTIYADPQHNHSVAAPTAGLHFTDSLLRALTSRGISCHELILDVGMGTFKPVETETLESHPMHEERFLVPPTTLDFLRARAASPGRLVAVGTTTVRALESLPDPLPPAGPYSAATRLLISPGFRFRFVQGLMTNFHLPRSTLLALVAAMIGLDRLKAIYAEAIAHRYRFYSYGDAMLILP